MASEWSHNIGQILMGSIYEAVHELCSHLFGFLFFYLNSQIEWAQSELKQPIDQWNPSVFVLIRDIVAKDVCIPIAAAFITFIFCFEIVQLLQDENRMRNINKQTLFVTIMKFCICCVLCAKSFDIVMGIYGIGTSAVTILGNQANGTLNSNLLSFDEILPAAFDEYRAVYVFQIIGDLLLIVFSIIIVVVLSAIIYVRITIWFLEFLIYASMAPIPFSTFDNKEWAQVGMNYTRKMLALSFEGFFMLLMLAMYGFITAGLSARHDFIETLTMLLGTGVALIMLMGKAGNISASIFNAH